MGDWVSPRSADATDERTTWYYIILSDYAIQMSLLVAMQTDRVPHNQYSYDPMKFT